MPKRRLRFKKKFNIDYAKLTDELYDAICHKVSMEEMLGGYEHLGYFEDMGFDRGYYFMFDKNDPEVCRKIWNLHKKAVMERFKTDPKNNAGTRPFLWWISERPEDIRIIRYEKWMDNSDKKPEPVELPDGSLEYEYPIYEDQAEYLKRLDLLESWEIQEIKALEERSSDFEEEERPPGFEEEEGIDELPY